jgi:hypothetical protein
MPRRSGLRRKIQLVFILLFFSVFSLSAVEGNFQINTVFQRTSYPLSGSGGNDIVRHTSAGIGLKITRGKKFQGVLDLAVLFPHKLEEKIYPAADFSERSISGFPIVIDAVLGFGYMFDLSPMVFLVSTGFHTGSLLEGGNSLVAFGLALDAQTFVRLGKIITAQIGLKFAVDFWGTQNFVPGSNELAGFPITFGLYTGIGLNY